jgi:hypothetical protein
MPNFTNSVNAASATTAPASPSRPRSDPWSGRRAIDRAAWPRLEGGGTRHAPAGTPAAPVDRTGWT